MIKFFTGAFSMLTVCISIMWIGEYVSVYHGIVLALFWLFTGATLTLIFILPRIDDR